MTVRDQVKEGRRASNDEPRMAAQVLRYAMILSRVRRLLGDGTTPTDRLPDAIGEAMARWHDAAALAQKELAESIREADEAYDMWVDVFRGALGEHWVGPAGAGAGMSDVERSINALAARFEARTALLRELTRQANLTDRAAGEAECGGEAEEMLALAGPQQAAAGRVPGVGKDAPVVVNERGGKQSHLQFRCDLLPALATLSVAQTLHFGADKYGDDNWKAIPVGSHLNHLLVHLFAHLAGDASDDHLEHAACRALMALQLHLEAKYAGGVARG